MTRDEAWKLVCEFTPSESLRRHMRTVEAVMLHFAEQSDQPDLEKWAVTGLLHDFDYESHPDLGPDGHPFWGVKYLREHTELPEDVLEAILGHYTGSGVARVTPLAKALSFIFFMILETSRFMTLLSGLTSAAAVIKPESSSTANKVFARAVVRTMPPSR